MKLKITLLFCCFSSALFCQNSIDSIKMNRAIHKTWGGDKIRFFTQQDPEYVLKGLYYFENSFTAKLKDCPSCEVDMDRLLNFDLFNVSDFEQYRKADVRNDIFYKDYEISLHSVQELESQLGTSLLEFNSGSEFVQFPIFDLTDLSPKKVEQYRDFRRYYILNYKLKYKERVAASNYRFLTIEQVKNLTQDELNGLLENPDLFEVILN